MIECQVTRFAHPAFLRTQEQSRHFNHLLSNVVYFLILGKKYVSLATDRYSFALRVHWQYFAVLRELYFVSSKWIKTDRESTEQRKYTAMEHL